MSNKNDWRKAQEDVQGAEINYPVFTKNVSFRLEVKPNTEGVLSFAYWDTEKKERKFITKSINGVLLGEGFRLQVFATNLGTNGSTIKSSTFLSKAGQGAVYAMGKKVVQGSFDKCKAEMESMSGDRVKTVKIYYIVDALGRTIEVSTNMSLGIADTQKLGGAHRDFFVAITPYEYDPNDYDTKTNEILGKFALRNKPKTARLTATEVPIPEEGFDGLTKAFTEFGEFKMFTANNDIVNVKEDDVVESPSPSIQDDSSVPF